MGHVCDMCVKCLEGIVYGMPWLVDDLWYSCNVVNFDSHISNDNTGRVDAIYKLVH